MSYVVQQEPRYVIRRVTLTGRQPLELELGFPADFIAFINTEEVDPSRVYVAFNIPSVFIPLSKIITARARGYVFTRLFFRWEPDQEGKTIDVYYAGAPSIEIGTQVVVIGADYTGIVKKGDLSFDENGYLNVHVASSVQLPSRGSPTRELDGYSLAAGSAVDIDKSDMDGWSYLAVTVKASFASGASSGVRILWLYSPDGVNYDSEEEAVDNGNYADIGPEPGGSRQATVAVPIYTPYLRIRVRNLDASNNVTVDVWTTTIR